MSETPPNEEANGQSNDAVAPSAPSLRVLAQYLKDHSFENPRAPASFQDNSTAPGIEVNVDVNARSLAPSQYEVELAGIADKALKLFDSFRDNQLQNTVDLKNQLDGVIRRLQFLPLASVLIGR